MFRIIAAAPSPAYAPEPFHVPAPALSPAPSQAPAPVLSPDPSQATAPILAPDPSQGPAAAITKPFREIYRPCGNSFLPGPVAPLVPGGADHGVPGSIQAAPILGLFAIIMEQNHDFGEYSVILDVGSGNGQLALAWLAIPGLEKFFSIGVEMQKTAYQVLFRPLSHPS